MIGKCHGCGFQFRVLEAVQFGTKRRGLNLTHSKNVPKNELEQMWTSLSRHDGSSGAAGIRNDRFPTDPLPHT